MPAEYILECLYLNFENLIFESVFYSKSIKPYKRSNCLHWIPLNNSFIHALSHSVSTLFVFYYSLPPFVCSIRHFKSNKIFTPTLIGVGNQYNGNRDCGCEYLRSYSHTRTHILETHTVTQMALYLWRYTYGQHCTYTPTSGRFCGWLLLLVKPQPQAHYEFAVSLSALALALERWIVN